MQTLRGVRRIFERGEGGRKFENNEDKKKGSSLRFSQFFCPGLGEDQKKSLPRFSPFFCRPNSKEGVHDSILCTILRHLCITDTPKRGPWHNAPPIYAPANSIRTYVFLSSGPKLMRKFHERTEQSMALLLSASVHTIG